MDDSHPNGVVNSAAEFLETVAWVEARDHRLLMVRPRGRDIWFMPGGKIDGGETAPEALARELREELNVELLEDSLRAFGVVEAPAWGRTGVTVRMHCFFARVRGTITPSSEIEELRWIAADEGHLCPPAGREVLRRALGAALL